MESLAEDVVIRKFEGIFNSTQATLIITYTNLQITTDAQSYKYAWAEVLGSYFSTDEELTIQIFTISSKSKKLISLVFITDQSRALFELIQTYSSLNDISRYSENNLKKRLKVILNPISGRGKSLKVWKKVESMFSSFDLDIQMTEYRGHATDIMINLNAEKYDGIIVVSGDGLVHEIINGVCKQPDPRLRNIPIGVIAAGSGNALAQYLCNRINQPVTPEVCAYICIKGVGCEIDISKVDFQDGRVIYSFLSVSWSYIADVDIESDRFRCCGIIRYDLYGAWRLLSLKRYTGTFTWETPEGEKSISGAFVYFWACNIPYVGEGMKVAPLAEHNDGMNDMFYMGNVSRYRLLRVLLRQDAGNHIGQPGLEYFKASRWSLEPNGGIFSIDGDYYPISSISVQVLKQRKGKASSR